MGYPQPPQYGSPPGMPPQPMPSSTSYACAGVFGMLGGTFLCFNFLDTVDTLDRMADGIVVMDLLQLVAGGCMIAGASVLFAKKFAGMFVLSGGTGLFLLTLFLIPAVTPVRLGTYLKVLFTFDNNPAPAGGASVLTLASAIVAISCGFAPGTRRYIDFANARRAAAMNNGMGYPQQAPQAMYPPQGYQQPYPQWGQQQYPQQQYPQQPYPQQQYPQSGQQPQQWYPGPQ